MITKDDIIKMARHISRRDQGYSDHRMLHPVRDWVIGLGISGIVFLFVSGYIGFDFYTQYRNVDAPIMTDESIVLYKQEKVNDVLQSYRNRTVQFDALRGDESNVFVAPVVEEEEDEEEPPLAEDAGGE